MPIIAEKALPGPVVNMVLDSLGSDHSKRAYERALTDFAAWYQRQGRPGLAKATVQRYKTTLLERELAPSTINQRLCAIRALAREAADNGALDPGLAGGIARVKGVAQHGRRMGNWLSKEQAQRLLCAPDASTLKGLRDRALLAVLVGCGLRRSEAAELTFSDIQQREARWAIIDLVGKGNRVRTVPMPSWAKAAIDRWAQQAGIADGVLDRMNGNRVFRSLSRHGHINGDSISPQTVADVVKEHAAACGFKALAAHDLRRTFAKLAYAGGAGLDQIQLSLGHASIRTTERYLGLEQDLHDAPCDRLGLRI
jgi:site-specific recombinase XerD